MKQVAPFRHRSHLCPLGQTSTFQTLMDGPIFSLWFMTLFIRLIRLKVAIVRMLPHTVDVMDVLILCWSSSSRQSSHLRQKGPTAAAGMPSVHQTNPIDRRIPTDSSFYFLKKKFYDEVRSWASGRTNSGPKWTRVGRSAPLYAPSNRIARQLKRRSHLTVVKVVKRGKCRSKKKIFFPRPQRPLMDVRLIAAGPGGGRRPVGADSFRPLMWQPSRSLTSGCNPLARHSAPVIICMASRRLWIGKINKTPVDVSTVKVSDTCPSGAEGAEADRPEFDGWRSSVTWYCSAGWRKKKSGRRGVPVGLSGRWPTRRVTRSWRRAERKSRVSQAECCSCLWHRLHHLVITSDTIQKAGRRAGTESPSPEQLVHQTKRLPPTGPEVANVAARTSPSLTRQSLTQKEREKTKCSTTAQGANGQSITGYFKSLVLVLELKLVVTNLEKNYLIIFFIWVFFQIFSDFFTNIFTINFSENQLKITN